MKIKLLNAIAIGALLMASCGEVESIDKTTESADVQEEIENVVEETIENEEVSNTVTDEQMAHYEELLDLSSTETTGSDCFITESFLYNDQMYITVDFVNYKLDEDSKNTDYEIYDLVNEIKTLRTFVVNEEYFTCSRDKKVTMEELLSKNKKDMVYSLECEDGVVTELYIDTCSG